MLTLVKLVELPSSTGRADTTIAYLEDGERGHFIITDVEQQWRRMDPPLRLEEAKPLSYKLDQFRWATLEAFLGENAKDKPLAIVDDPVVVCKVVKAAIGKEAALLEDRLKHLEAENRALKRQLTLSTPLEKATPTKAPGSVPPVQKGTSLVNPRVKRAKAKGSLFSDDDDDN
jgi:hypothetical protein